MQSHGLQMPASLQPQLARIIDSMTAVHVLPKLPPVTTVDSSYLQLATVTTADRQPTVELSCADPCRNLAAKTEDLPSTRVSSDRKRKSWSTTSLQTPAASSVIDCKSSTHVKQLKSETEQLNTSDQAPQINVLQYECTRCHAYKSFDQFGKESRLTRGFNTQCKACIKGRRASALQAKRAQARKMDQTAEDLSQYQCGLCLIWLTADQVYSDKHTTSGLANRCKVCAAGCNAIARLQLQQAQADAAPAKGWKVYQPSAYNKLYLQDDATRTIQLEVSSGELITIDVEVWSCVRDNVIGVERGQAYVVLCGRDVPLVGVVMDDGRRMMHVNGDLLDCRKANLRPCVPPSKQESDAWHEPSSSAWRCTIQVEGQQIVRQFTCDGHGRAAGHALYEAALQAAVRFKQEKDALNSVQLTEDYCIEDDDRYLAVHSIP